MVINSKLYDTLKPVALLYLPALATLYFAVAAIWHIPATEQVVGTITAVNTCIGGLLGLSSSNYTPPTHGALVVNGTDLKSVQIPMTPEEIAAKKTIVLKVQPESETSISSNPPTQPSAIQPPATA